MIGGNEVELWTGEQLEHRDVAHAGDYLYITAGTPHAAVNRGERSLGSTRPRLCP